MDLAALGPYCQDLGPIFSQYGPRAWLIRCIYYTEIRNQLEGISFDRARSACIRSKVRWHEFGERSSKYFLNLEKRNYENKFITRLTKDDESCLTDPKEVLEEQRRFYSTLYSSQNPRVNDPRFNLLFTGDMIKTLDNEQKESCEGLLTVEECKEALKNFSKNKSPGTDGLTAEFYSFFGDLLSDTMVNNFNYGFQKGKLTVSQRQSTIRLIQKKDKDLSRLKNWRPISLLNLDYKIATKALALRLKKVLPSIINDAQTGYLYGGSVYRRKYPTYIGHLTFHSSAKFRGHCSFYRL